MGLLFHQGCIKLSFWACPSIVVDLAFEPHLSWLHHSPSPTHSFHVFSRGTADPSGSGTLSQMVDVGTGRCCKYDSAPGIQGGLPVGPNSHDLEQNQFVTQCLSFLFCEQGTTEMSLPAFDERELFLL